LLGAIALALLRVPRIPARYVSGYLHPFSDPALATAPASESHAWVEAWVGEWVPFDPANDGPVGKRDVVVDRACHYADVGPLIGIFHGEPAKAFGVSVELTRLS
jgi:transglutaminase-like putative cysteine protease